MATRTAFLYISLSSLHDYDVKMPNCTFCWGRKKSDDEFFLSPSEFECGPQEINSWKNLPTLYIFSETE